MSNAIQRAGVSSKVVGKRTGRFGRAVARATARAAARAVACAVEGLEPRIVLSGYVVSDVAGFDPPPAGYDPRSALVRDSAGNLFGTTYSGGTYDKGTIFEVPAGATGVTTIASFSGDNGANPSGDITLDASGNIFGTAENGGDANVGTVYELPKGAAVITTLGSFDTANGAHPKSGVAMDAAGNLYGTASQGGILGVGGAANGQGSVFEIAAGSNAITALVLFNDPVGASPQGKVALDASGNLFGAAPFGGAKGLGMVFEVAAGTKAVTTVASFNGTNGSAPLGGVIMDASGNLFGTASNDGPNASGTIFEVGQGSNLVTRVATFRGTNGATPIDCITMDAAGNIFGSTSGGGTGSQGVVYEMAAGTGIVTALAQFAGANGSAPYGGVAVDSAGNVFGTTEAGGAGSNAAGTVFEIPAGASLTTLSTLTASSSAFPEAGVTFDSAGNLWGTTPAGGANGMGKVYEVAKGTHAVTTVASFNGSKGSTPKSGVVFDSAGNLYGTTSTGGALSRGAVYEIAKNTGAITLLASFNLNNGSTPSGQLAIDSAGDLFGTAQLGGANSDGVVWELVKGATSISVLASFNGTNGAAPVGGVVLDSSGNLFGTASAGGDANGDGTVFEVAKGTKAITAIATFNGADGSMPMGGVALDSTGTLFGTTSQGGDNNQGTVFKVPSAASGGQPIIPLASFNGANGSAPMGGVAIDSSGNVFGTTQDGGDANDDGLLWEVARNSSTITTVALFNGANGGSPVGALTFDASGNLYGTTPNGGPVGTGTVFTLVPAASVTAVSLSDGSTTANQAQRSQVRQLTLSFDGPVALTAGQLNLSLLNSGGSGTSANGGNVGSPTTLRGVFGTPVAVSGSNNTLWTVPVLAGTPYTDTTGSLNDGIYTLNVTGVAANGITNFTFHRLYGDTDGNKSVNALDYARFKSAFGNSAGAAAYNADLDFDNNGTINALDFAQFKKRFGTTFTY